MSTLTLPVAGTVGRTCRHLSILVRPGGICIPGYQRGPELPLDVEALIVIEAFARGDDPGRGPEVDGLIRALADHGLVAARPADRTPWASNELWSADRRTATEPSSTLCSDDELVLPSPVLLACGPNGFEYADHDGRVGLSLSAVELCAVAAFRAATTTEVGFARHGDELGERALDRPTFDDLVGRGLRGGLLVPFDPDDPVQARDSSAAERMRENMRRMAAVHAEFDRLEAEHDSRGDRVAQPRVIGFHSSWSSPPASLGMVLAAAMHHEGGRLAERYDFRPRLAWDGPRWQRALDGSPAIFLFSNYIWSTDENLAHSAWVKEADPRHITIHGGPNTPKYPDDVERWFAANPHIDVAVHGEGEATFCDLLDHLEQGPDESFELACLAEVPGLSFRDGDHVRTTEPRDRIADLNALPSPVLTGLFDGFIPAAGDQAGLILETNRGCPYGCTFCDWGSATLSRIRQFDRDRVFAEITWCAEHHLGIGIADANFGIFERDVEIAEHIVEMKSVHGYPKVVGNNYAKNTVKHLSKIIDLFTEAGIVAEGKMSMQSFDQETLHTIRRKNIKVERYQDLAVEFRRNRLPLAVELMVGLPGSTPAGFRNDLQSCVDRDLRAAAYPTVLLPNSPMNEASYRSAHGIVARPGEELHQTSSYTRQDYDEMMRLRNGFYVFENFGVLRQVAAHVRAQTGMAEIDFYARLVEDARDEPERRPSMTLATQVLPEVMVPPVSWARFLAEVRHYVVEVLGVADDSALATVLAVQHALIPARGRRFPVTLDLAHDYVAWHDQLGELRDQGHYDDWHELIPPLRSFGPGVLEVNDPLNSSGIEQGMPCWSISYFDSAWDMVSPVSRPRQAAVATGLGDP